MIKDQLVGAWRLVSMDNRQPDGAPAYPFGKRTTGLIIYSADGHMSAQIMGLDRPLFASGDRLVATADELKAAFKSYQAYYGTYHVDEARGTVVHRVQGCIFPNNVGSDQIRYYELNGNRLTLRTPPIRDGGATRVGVLVWERAGEG